MQDVQSWIMTMAPKLGKTRLMLQYMTRCASCMTTGASVCRASRGAKKTAACIETPHVFIFFPGFWSHNSKVALDAKATHCTFIKDTHHREASAALILRPPTSYTAHLICVSMSERPIPRLKKFLRLVRGHASGHVLRTARQDHMVAAPDSAEIEARYKKNKK